VGAGRRALSVAVALTLTLFAAPAALAGPVGQAAGFEDDDGNLAPGDVMVIGQPSPNFDWNSFDPVTWSPHPATTPTRQTDDKVVNGFQFKGIEDYPNPGATSGTTADTSFNGGVKQDHNCAGVGTGKPPNKDDLSRVYLASKVLNGQTFLELAWARIPQNSTSASAHVGFEFNQGTTACPAGSNGLVQRTEGDVLIVYDFEGGSAAPVLTLRRWVTSLGAACEVVTNVPPCWGTAQDLTAGGFAEGRVNTSNVTDALSPPALDSATGTSVDRTLATQEFGEAGINLTAAGVIPLNTCVSFGKAYAVSRSSGNSAQAQMKDLVGPANFNLQNCGTIKIIKQTSPRGIDQDFDFTSNIAGAQLLCTTDTTPADFTLNDAGNSGKTPGSTDPAQNSAGNTETCANVPVGSYTVTEGADPPGFAFDSLTCTASGTSTSVTTSGKVASITLAGGGSVTCLYTNLQQLGAIKILKTSSKTGNVLADATFSITGPNGYSNSVTTASDGSVCVDGLTFGTYTVTETGAPPGFVIDDPSGHSVVVDNNAECSDSPYVGETTSFTDTPVADIQVRFRDGGSGETSATISCNNPTGTTSLADTTGWDDTTTVTGIHAPVIVTCTIDIDP
jgi:hypothetical protein